MSTPANTPFTVVVEIQDPDGDVCANGEADVPCVISLDNIPSGSEGAVLSGTTTKTPVSGVLTFDDLEIDLAGVGYTLKVQTVSPIDIYPVSTGSLVAKISGAITISPPAGQITFILAGAGYYLFEYSTPSGSMNPSTYNGLRVDTIGSQPSGNVFFLELDTGGLGQSHFTSVTINGVTFLTSAATYFDDSSTFSYWQWTDGRTVVSAAGTYDITWSPANTD